MNMRSCVRIFLQVGIIAGGSGVGWPGGPAAMAADTAVSAPAVLRVAAVQLRSSADLRANVAKVKGFLAECAEKKVEIAVFPECAVSGYSKEGIQTPSAADFAAAEREIAAACKEHSIAAIVGMPVWHDGKMFDSALIVNARGEIVARYDKFYPTTMDRSWGFNRGSGLPPVFPVGPTLGSVMICHDSRFPELCRLPVLAGARVVFYVSCEAGLFKEHKMAPYRAQVQARAVENGVYVVHANTPADEVRTGSHGQSRIVDPNGNIMQEATQLQEEMLVADLDLSKATAEFALETMDGAMADWWRKALSQVPVIK